LDRLVIAIRIPVSHSVKFSSIASSIQESVLTHEL
jgi:hypothetical protein